MAREEDGVALFPCLTKGCSAILEVKIKIKKIDPDFFWAEFPESGRWMISRFQKIICQQCGASIVPFGEHKIAVQVSPKMRIPKQEEAE